MLRSIAVGLAALLIFVVFYAVLAWIPVWLLWNWLMPELFGLPDVTLGQALGILLLAGFLFKSSSSSKKSD